jgi:hypothetical protein
MNCHLVATRTKLFDFHPIGVVLLIFAAQVVLFTADGAFEYKIITHKLVTSNICLPILS